MSQFSWKHCCALVAVLVAGACSDATPPAPAATKLGFVNQRTTTIAGESIEDLRIAIVDQNGVPMPSESRPVTVTLVGGSGATLLGTTTVMAIDGIATFSDLKIQKADDDYMLIASTPGLAGDTSNVFEIAAADPVSLTFVQQPANVTAGAPISVQVTAVDAFGNTVMNSAEDLVITIATNPGGGTLSGTVSIAIVDGVATFSDLSIDMPGTGYVLSVDCDGVTATSAAFTVNPAPPAP